MPTAKPGLKLSVLDQSILRQGGSPREALLETVQIAQLAETLGFTRFWVSEHHNLPMVAGSAPEILMVKLAEATNRLRIGAGGIMLPNHSSLKVAENFRLLESLYPGRIDLGLGRAPGGDRVTAALLNPANDFSERSFVEQLEALQLFLTDTAGTEHGSLLAIPQAATLPDQWLLSSSGGSSRLAGQYGMGLAVAKFINGQVDPETVVTYRQHFVPSGSLPEPRPLVAVMVLCAETAAKAFQLRKAFDYQLLQMEKGILEGIRSYESIRDYEFSLYELERIKFNSGRIVSGTPDLVREELLHLAGRFGVEEIMVSTMAYDFEDRCRSFELLAAAFGLNIS